MHRQIQDWEFYFDEPFNRAMAWIDLLLLANHDKTSYRVRGNQVVVERGQIARGEEHFAKRWQWSRGKVRRFLEELKTRQQIVQQKSAIVSTITIQNYSKYQENDTTDGQQKDNRRTHTRMYKKEKNEKEDTNTALASPNADDEVNQVFKRFYDTINPQIQFGNRTQRSAAEDLLKRYGLPKVLAAIDYAVGIATVQYAPTITTPVQLRDKLAALIAHQEKSKSKSLVAEI